MHNSRLVFDPSFPNIDHSKFWECDSTDFDEGTVETIPPDAPLPGKNEVDLFMFVDSNHADTKHFKRFRTRFVIYMNMS